MNKKIGNLFKGDKGIWMVFFFLCLISLIEVFSASSTLSFKSHNYMGPIIYRRQPRHPVAGIHLPAL